MPSWLFGASPALVGPSKSKLRYFGANTAPFLNYEFGSAADFDSAALVTWWSAGCDAGAGRRWTSSMARDLREKVQRVEIPPKLFATRCDNFGNQFPKMFPSYEQSCSFIDEGPSQDETHCRGDSRPASIFRPVSQGAQNASGSRRNCWDPGPVEITGVLCFSC